MSTKASFTNAQNDLIEFLTEVNNFYTRLAVKTDNQVIIIQKVLSNLRGLSFLINYAELEVLLEHRIIAISTKDWAPNSLKKYTEAALSLGSKPLKSLPFTTTNLLTTKAKFDF